jgi:hypothetical protein
MFLIHAKDDGFLETVVALLQEVRDFLGNKFGTFVNDEGAVEIFNIVDAVLDLIAVPVYVTLSGR